MEVAEIEANTGWSKAPLEEFCKQREPALPKPFFITGWVIHAGLIGGREGGRQLLITHTFSEVLGPESCSPSQDLLPFYPFGCSIQDSDPTVLHCSLLKFILPAHSLYQAFDPFMTRSTLPLIFYPPEAHSLNPASCLWLSHPLAHISNFQHLVALVL